MNQKTIIAILGVAVIILIGTTVYKVAQQPVPAPVTQQKEQPTNQTTVPTETLSYCGKSFVAEKVEIGGVGIVNRILQLSIAKDKGYCTNFEQIENIAVLKTSEGNTINIVLYESKSLTEADRQLSAEKQLEKINSNENFPQTNEYSIKGDTIYVISQFDGSEQYLGKLK